MNAFLAHRPTGVKVLMEHWGGCGVLGTPAPTSLAS